MPHTTSSSIICFNCDFYPLLAKMLSCWRAVPSVPFFPFLTLQSWKVLILIEMSIISLHFFCKMFLFKIFGALDFMLLLLEFESDL